MFKNPRAELREEGVSHNLNVTPTLYLEDSKSSNFSNGKTEATENDIHPYKMLKKTSVSSNDTHHTNSTIFENSSSILGDTSNDNGFNLFNDFFYSETTSLDGDFSLEKNSDISPELENEAFTNMGIDIAYSAKEFQIQKSILETKSFLMNPIDQEEISYADELVFRDDESQNIGLFDFSAPDIGEINTEIVMPRRILTI